MKMKTVLQSQLEDTEAFAPLTKRGAREFAIESLRAGMPAGKSEAMLNEIESSGIDGDAIRKAVERLRSGDIDMYNLDRAEAIVVASGYPALIIQDGDFEAPQEGIWLHRLTPHRAAIKRVIKSVARVEWTESASNPHIGTCWLVDNDVLLTNRHVVEAFARVRNGTWDFIPGLETRVQADFAEEYDRKARLEHLVSQILHVEEAEFVDIAAVRLSRGTGRALDLEPLTLSTELNQAEYLGVIGYPGNALRDNPINPFKRLFKNIFGVKRLSPGQMIEGAPASEVFAHNATTLGGNSGSVVIDISTGDVVGVHFWGEPLKYNFAVKSSAVQETLRRGGVRFYLATSHATGRSRDRRRDSQIDDRDGGEARASAASFSDRNGYDPAFLGDGELAVPLPILSPQQAANVAKVGGKAEIKYRNFSVVLSKPRRLAYLTAVNIDGSERRNPVRRRAFALDPRLDETRQAGESLYRGNAFDRGHLVRRLDPCWGSADDAEQANVDSMFFPNIAPQHERLNQDIWNDLEDHILTTVDQKNWKVSVFTGCVFTEHDKLHEPSGIRVPMAFWKVVVSRRGRRRGSGSRLRGSEVLEAQAFVMSQEHLVKPQDFEAVFGEGFETFQVTVEQLERMTGLDFHKLKAADTFGMPPDLSERHARESTLEGAMHPRDNPHYHRLGSVDDIVL